MTNNLMSNVQFQIRLVKELRGSSGKQGIITLPFLAKPKDGFNDDHTLRLYATEKSALQAARNYCNRSDERKGLSPGSFLGIVMVKFEGDSTSAKRVPRTIPQNRIGGHSRIRVNGTTTWLYYIEPQLCKVFHVETNSSGEHYIGEEIIA